MIKIAAFLKENSYSMVKVFLTQIVMSFFGTMLAIATLSNPSLLLASSVFSVLFYLVMVYFTIWEIGAKDKIRIDGGRLRPFPAKGAVIALGGNAPNLLLALLMGVGVLINTKGAQVMSLVCNAIARLLNGAYLGILKTLENLLISDLPEGSGTMPHIWWWFIVMTLPSILTGLFAYFMGSHDYKISAFLGLSKRRPADAQSHSAVHNNTVKRSENNAKPVQKTEEGRKKNDKASGLGSGSDDQKKF
ncbi:MAG: hypothetical protein ACI4T6_03110 [Candidatus Flemingiibacterium sp.]